MVQTSASALSTAVCASRIAAHDEHITPALRAQRGFTVTRATAVPAAGTEFDEFLYAPVGEENNGMLLSMLSALARLDVDPWDEASRLARLPRPAAIQFLTALIAGLPDGSSARSDPELHAQRLTALLPQRVATITPTSNPTPATGFTTYHQGLVRYALFYLLLTASFFGAQWLIEHSQSPAHSGAVTSPATGAALPRARPVN
jgi:hypothetical protein